MYHIFDIIRIVKEKIKYYEDDNKNYFPNEPTNQKIITINKAKINVLNELIKELEEFP